MFISSLAEKSKQTPLLHLPSPTNPSPKIPDWIFVLNGIETPGRQVYCALANVANITGSKVESQDKAACEK